MLIAFVLSKQEFENITHTAESLAAPFYIPKVRLLLILQANAISSFWYSKLFDFNTLGRWYSNRFSIQIVVIKRIQIKI